ncbi:peptide deformylase [Shewanella atlantica]|uniref:Peptide deformylase n=1 Tax=Shewanella atlantica TaxID=271099 RepID=A0A431WHC7_9GAMM|nr:peptide deformylase [Shewanella atlantica]RTR34914.1 peptide deformylase [Shewanella atlantica]
MLAIAQVGEEVLTLVARAVTDFSPELRGIVEEMLLSMEQAEGVGIAAPQIHLSLALFIMASRPTQRYPEAPYIAPTVIINPEILEYSPESEAGEEGCLSIPERRLSITRHRWVQVKYQDLDGQWHNQRLSGFIARIFQHEYDHLQGITLFERAAMQEQGRDEASQ